MSKKTFGNKEKNKMLEDVIDDHMQFDNLRNSPDFSYYD